ncbi:site-specific tyrosine recombinase XerC [compost metagenome]
MMEKAGLLQEVEENGKKFIRPKYHPYALRHYYASMLIANNIAITRIQKLMGHKDPSITLNTYAHLMKNTDESDADLVRAAVSRMYVS